MPKLKELVEFPTTLKSATVSGLGSLIELDFHNTLLDKLKVEIVPRLKTLDVRNTRMGEQDVDRLQLAMPAVKVNR